MDRETLLTTDFTLTDRLAPALRDRLSSLALLLDARPPWAHDDGEAAEQTLAREQAARDARLREARDGAFALVEPSQFDLQVLVTLMRAEVEVSELGDARFVLESLRKVLGEPWERMLAAASGPEPEKLKRRASRYFSSLFSQLELKLAREREADASRFSRALRAEDVEWSTLFDSVLSAFANRGLDVSGVGAVSDMLLPANQKPVGEGSREDAASDAESVDTPQVDVDEAVPEDGSVVSTRRHVGTQMRDDAEVTLKVSTQFFQLQQRLEAFSTLLGESQYEKASLVARDLQATLDAFDVALFFPTLFADFFVGLADHAEGLSRFESPPEHPRHRALLSLYRSDLSRFLSLPSGKA